MIFEIMAVLNWSQTFRDVYGMRFTGLADAGSSTYIDYGVPDPEAPYPQDYVIDQNGIVRHWSWEYDPREIIETIDGLLALGGVEDGEGRPGPGGSTSRLWLAPPAPSPFRPETEIRFRLPAAGPVSLAVYDVGGRLVRSLVKGERGAGDHILAWDGRDVSGRRASSGVYFIVLDAGGDRLSRRAILLR